MKKITIAILVLVFLQIVFVIQNYSHPAWGIVIDRQKQIYFTDLETVYKIDSQGKLSVFRAGVGGRHLHDLAIDARDNVYGIDNSYEPRTQKFFRGIWKMSAKGEFTQIVPLTENLPIGMSVWRDLEGNTFSVEPYNNEKRESKLIRRTTQGKTNLFAGGTFGFADGKKENAKFGNVVDMDFAPNGAIYLTDSDKIRRIDKNGTVKTIYNPEPSIDPKNLDSGSRKLYGLAVDRQNNVFIADFGNRKLLKINSRSEVTTIYSSENDWSPLGVTTFQDEVYILEGRSLNSPTHIGNRVVKVSSDNKSLVISDLEDAKNSEDIKNQNNFLFKSNSSDDSISETELKIAAAKSKIENNQLGFYGTAGLLIAVLLTVAFLFTKTKSTD